MKTRRNVETKTRKRKNTSSNNVKSKTHEYMDAVIKLLHVIYTEIYGMVCMEW